MRMGRESRVEYYIGRMGAMGRADRLYPLVERMAAEDVDAVAFATAEALVGDETVNAAVQRGVMTEGEDSVLSFGIPSFRNYLIHRAAQHRDLSRGRKPDNDSILTTR